MLLDSISFWNYFQKRVMISARFTGIAAFSSSTVRLRTLILAAVDVLAAYILPELAKGTWKRVLFVPTGALLSKTSFNEGDSIPGIAHAVVLEHESNEKKEA